MSVVSVYAADKVKYGALYYYLDSSTRTASVTSPASGSIVERSQFHRPLEMVDTTIA